MRRGSPISTGNEGVPLLVELLASLPEADLVADDAAEESGEESAAYHEDDGGGELGRALGGERCGGSGGRGIGEFGGGTGGDSERGAIVNVIWKDPRRWCPRQDLNLYDVTH